MEILGDGPASVTFPNPCDKVYLMRGFWLCPKTDPSRDDLVQVEKRARGPKY